MAGTALFLKDRMVGKLSGDETKTMLMIKNVLQGGVLVVDDKRGTRRIPWRLSPIRPS